MTEETLKEPVINEKNEPCYLTRTIKKESTTDLKKKKAKEIIEENKPLVDVPVFTLEKQGLWTCQKCNARIYSNPSTPDFCFEDQGGCNRHSTFKPYTKIVKPGLWKFPRWEDVDIRKNDLYSDMLSLIKRVIVFSDEIEYKIFTLWIISTWKLESWETVGFPCFIGIPNSGKTQALFIIYNLGYRASKTSGVSSAVIPRLCQLWNVTLLVDECHNKLNPKTSEGSLLVDFVKDSYRRGSTYVTCDLNDQDDFKVYRNYGFKAFAGEKTFNPGLLTRGFIFWMEKANPEVSKLVYVQRELDDLQTRLLNYRFKTENPPDLGNDFILKGRTREIFESIISTAKHLGVTTDDIIQYAKDRDRREEDAIQGSDECEILTVIKDFETNPYKLQESDRVSLDELIRELGWEEDPDNRKKLGWTIRNLGLVTKKIGHCRNIMLDDPDNIKQLRKKYKRYHLGEQQEKLKT